MKHKAVAALLAGAMGLGLAGAKVASAQITTGTVLGTVNDAQGGAIPGATVVLISETRGTRTAPVVTNATGDFAIPNLTADTYTVEVTMDGFRTISRRGIPVSGGDRVSVPALILEVGGVAEVVTVTGQSALIQAQSGERSAVVSTEQVQNLPISSRNFTAVLNTVPGVTGTARLGGGGQNNIMYNVQVSMDGTTWSALVAQGSGPQSFTVATFRPVDAKFVRITPTGRASAGELWAIQQARVFALPR